MKENEQVKLFLGFEILSERKARSLMKQKSITKKEMSITKPRTTKTHWRAIRHR